MTNAKTTKTAQHEPEIVEICPSELGIRRMAENLLRHGITDSYERIDGLIQCLEHVPDDTCDDMFIGTVLDERTGYRLPSTASDLLIALYLRARIGYTQQIGQ